MVKTKLNSEKLSALLLSFGLLLAVASFSIACKQPCSGKADEPGCHCMVQCGAEQDDYVDASALGAAAYPDARKTLGFNPGMDSAAAIAAMRGWLGFRCTS